MKNDPEKVPEQANRSSSVGRLARPRFSAGAFDRNQARKVPRIRAVLPG